MLRSYITRPEMRYATKILPTDKVEKMDGTAARYTLYREGDAPIDFSAEEPVAVGDYVVAYSRFSGAGAHHCGAVAFESRHRLMGSAAW